LRAKPRDLDDEGDALDSDGESGDDDEVNELWEGGDGFGQNDYSHLTLKPDHANRPLWICSDGRIFLESFSPVYKAAYDFLISVAEPVCRPANMHEYVLTPHSLYAAVSVGLETATILSVLARLSKTRLSSEIHAFVEACTANYGKVKLVLQRNRFFLESPEPRILKELLKDDVVRKARVLPTASGAAAGAGAADAFTVTKALRDKAAAAVTLAAIEENFDAEVRMANGDGVADGSGRRSCYAFRNDFRTRDGSRDESSSLCAFHLRRDGRPRVRPAPRDELVRDRTRASGARQAAVFARKLGVPHFGGVRLPQRHAQSRFGHRAQAHDPHPAVPGEVLKQDVRQRARAERHHRFALRRGQVSDRHRRRVARAQVRVVSLHVLGVRWTSGRRSSSCGRTSPTERS
jgi:hypothetical protein